jgi:hypothetical protein
MIENMMVMMKKGSRVRGEAHSSGKMSFATALTGFSWRKLQLTRKEMLRMLMAGTAWGVAMSAGLAGMTFWNCGMICQDDLIKTTTLSFIAGILAIGPLAAYGRR